MAKGLRSERISQSEFENLLLEAVWANAKNLEYRICSPE